MTHLNMLERVVKSTLKKSSPGRWKSTTSTAACRVSPRLALASPLMASLSRGSRDMRPEPFQASLALLAQPSSPHDIHRWRADSIHRSRVRTRSMAVIHTRWRGRSGGVHVVPRAVQRSRIHCGGGGRHGEVFAATLMGLSCEAYGFLDSQ